jgi:hypothetical protein
MKSIVDSLSDILSIVEDESAALIRERRALRGAEQDEINAEDAIEKARDAFAKAREAREQAEQRVSDLEQAPPRQ